MLLAGSGALPGAAGLGRYVVRMVMSAGSFAAASLPEWITAIATGIGVLVAVIAIAVTARQVRLTARQMRESAVREAQNSEDQTRPYVGADFVPGLAGAPSIDVVIANYGNSTARDLRLEVVGASFEPLSEGDELAPALGRFFSAGFDLAPTATRRAFWHHPANEDAEPSGAMGAPLMGEVRLTYSWQPGDGAEERHYEERLRYDLTDFLVVAPAPSEGPSTTGTGTETQLRNAVHALRAVATHIAELRR